MEIILKMIFEKIKGYTNVYALEDDFYHFLSERLYNIPRSKHIEFLTNLKDEIKNIENLDKDFLEIANMIVDSLLEERGLCN